MSTPSHTGNLGNERTDKMAIEAVTVMNKIRIKDIMNEAQKLITKPLEHIELWDIQKKKKNPRSTKHIIFKCVKHIYLGKKIII